MSNKLDAGLTRKSFMRSGLTLALAGAGGSMPQAISAEEASRSHLAEESRSHGYVDGARLILLGTAGGPALRKFRSEPSNLLVVNGTPYIVDIGYGAMHQLLFAGYRPVDIAGLFITHQHWDHDADMAAMIGFNWVEGRQSLLQVFGPYGTKQMIDGALNYFKIPERTFSKQMTAPRPASSFLKAVEVLENGVFYRDDNITVTAAENSHYQTFNAGLNKSFSYRFDTPHRSIVFTGDTGYSDAVIALARDADVLVSEVIRADLATQMAAKNNQVKPENLKGLSEHMWQEHLPPENVGKMAALANVKMVVLTHFAPGLDLETDAEAYTARVRQFYDGPVIAGRDLLEL
jgi:ribonuclease BN (tRNA processing enzyme)